MCESLDPVFTADILGNSNDIFSTALLLADSTSIPYLLIELGIS